jgi:hypothetical protein
MSTEFEDLSVDSVEDCALIRLVEREKSFRPDGRRLYFDYGTVGVDRHTEAYQQKLDDVLKAKGLVEGKDFRKIKHEGTEHHLSAWRARLAAPFAVLVWQLIVSPAFGNVSKRRWRGALQMILRRSGR